MADLDLARFPRLPLLGLPTPIEPLAGLTRHLGDALSGVRLFVKRDDLAGFGGGGNKLRKLEFLLGAARAEGSTPRSRWAPCSRTTPALPRRPRRAAASPASCS